MREKGKAEWFSVPFCFPLFPYHFSLTAFTTLINSLFFRSYTMKLVGSRTTDTYDHFSDWDYHVDAPEDFDQIAAKIAESVAWNLVKRGRLYVATVIDTSGTMWDYSGTDEPFGQQWEALGTPDPLAQPVYDYWIIAFKHLKGIYRGYDELAAVGMEMSTGLSRDIYLSRKYDIRNYKNFFAYKPVADTINADEQLKQTTGLPYTTTAEKLHKLTALNDLVLAASPNISTAVHQVFQAKIQELAALLREKG